MSFNTGYKIRNKQGIYFITFAVVHWVDVFTRKAYCDIVTESIQYCQAQKGLIVHAWCIMSNHLHLIISTAQNNTSDVLRDFKKFTSKQVIKAIENNVQESRREWMLAIFKKAGEGNSRNSNYQFWQQDNHPIELFSEDFAAQKLNYLHNNPVTAGIVYKAEEYVYSSAMDYYEGKNCGLIKVDFLF
jgi:putative transposase